MESKTKRNIKNIRLIVRILYKKEISGIMHETSDDMVLYQLETIAESFNRYTTKNNITLYNNKIKNFYLMKKGEFFLLDDKEQIMNLGLNSGDIIKIKFSDENLDNTQDFLYKIKKSNIKTNSKRIKIIITSISIIALILLVAIILLYHFVFMKKEKEMFEKEKYQKEELVANISYNSDIIYWYESNKKIRMIVEGFNISESDSIKSLEQYMDFIFIIRNKYFEIENNITQKNWFTGYLGILNITINNGTNNMTILYDKKLNDIIKKEKNKNKLRNLNNEDNSNNLNNDFIVDNDTHTFIKIDFYENGEIKNIHLPNKFKISNMVFFNNIIKLMIPKLSPDLYSKNITEKLKELNHYSSKSELEFEEEEEIVEKISEKDIWDIMSDNYSNEIEEEKLMRETEKENIFTRRLDENTQNKKQKENELLNNLENDFEESIEPKSINESFTIELREVNSYRVNNKSILNKTENNILKNYTNLTQINFQTLENDNMTLKSSELNTKILSNINEKGILFLVNEIQNAVINQPDSMDIEEEAKIKNENLRNEIYNSKNQISMEDASFDDEKINNDFSFNISKMFLDSINNISFLNNYDNEKLKRELYNYFDEFEYILYDESKYEENRIRTLNKVNDINENIIKQRKYENLINKYHKKLKRKLGNNNEYYGMKTFLYAKDFFDQNLLGLVLQGTAYSEVEPSTGYIENYFNLKLSRFKIKFKLGKQLTNLHIILKNINKMTFDFIYLLHQSNNNLKNNNIKYGDIIINIEKNASNLFEKYFDYSGIFTESLDNLYFEVGNFTKQFLEDLILLIDNVHANFSLILFKTKNDTYEFINEIREITKKSYIEYTNNMLINLEIFNNKTLLFLNNIEEETKKLDIFQIDLLYDIIDVIYDSKIIFKEFNKNLFKSIEKGIIIFKLDIQDYIQKILSELLYIADFLSINLNKNDILRNAIEESQRNITTQKLKDFRNIILNIIDIQIDKISNDYNNEMMSKNINSIKYFSENATKKFINDIEINSDKVTKIIKSKIKFINLYEIYSNNINEINYIFKKVSEDFNNDIHNNIIKNISLLFPEFINNERSILIHDKKILFNITKKLISNINYEINEINKGAISLSDKYINENLYYLHYNLYNFRKSFLDENLNKLLNDFVLIVENNMKINYIQLINENYELAFQYLNEENNFISSIGGDIYLGSEFINRYQIFLKKFKEFMALSFSDGFISTLEKYFYKIKNDILNYINEKMKSINKYNITEEIIKNNFYLIEQIYDEMNNLTENIDNFFNEQNFNMKIKIMVINIGTEYIQTYDEEKEKLLTNLYDNINKRIGNKVYGSSGDFVKRVKKRKKWKRLWKKYYVFEPYYCNSRNNVNKININLSKIENNILTHLNSLINNYINNIEPFITSYINISQKLYTNIYNFYEDKMNNHENIENIMNEYGIIFNDMINKIKTNILITDNFKFEDSFQLSLVKYENILNEMMKKYFKLIYMKDYEDFLEYPEEIIYKIEQFKNELKQNINKIKEKIIKTHQKRIINIIKITKKYIQNIHDFNYNYSLIHLNNSKNNLDYFLIKKNKIKEYFCSLSQNLSIKLKEIGIEVGDNNTSINQNNLIIDIDDIEKNYSDFVFNIKKTIEKNFTIEICKIINTYNSDSDIFFISDFSQNSNMIECFEEIKKSELNYSKYNFNTVKLRNEIYFTKTILEEMDNLLDDIDYNSIINPYKINEYDLIINDKNILNIYDESEYKLKEIQEENIFLLDESFELLTNNLKNYYNLQNEISFFFDSFENIIKFENLNYSDYLKNYNENLLKEIYDILKDFENVLDDQMKLKNKYQNFNIDENYFNKTYQLYYSELLYIFNNYKSKINKLKTTGIFYNSLKLIIRNFKKNQAIFYKNQFDSYINKLKYKFDFFGYNYDLGEKIYSFLQKEYWDYEFNLKYNYFLLYENNSDTYIKKLIQEISSIENIILTKFEKIYQDYIYTYKQNANESINFEYYNEYIKNKNKCLEYKGKKLIDLINQDLLSIGYNEEYIEYILNECAFDEREFLFNKIIKNNNSELISDFDSDIIESNSMMNVNYFNCDIINERITDFKNIKQFKICEENDFFNSSIMYFKGFTEENKNKLDRVVKNIKLKIEANYIDGYFLYEYLKNNVNQNNEELYIENFDIYIENIYEIVVYINNLKDSEYKSFLTDIFKNFFNISYINLVNNYLIEELLDNTTIIINDKIELYIDYITAKIMDEYLYYIFLINKTESLGYTTKLSIDNLFIYYKEKISESINNTIENEVNFYIDIFYRENKDIFAKNFINYYYQEKNEYNISLYKIKNYLDEILIEKNFNKTLDIISNSLIWNVTNKLKEKVEEIANYKLIQLFSLLNDISQNLKNLTDEKEIININEDMMPIYNLTQDFFIVVKNQNNRFNFKVNEEPFYIINNFIENELRPPLLLLKNKYDLIEDKILNLISEIADNFPDCYSIVRDNFINNRINTIYNYIDEINETILNYKEDINQEIESYINKLSFYTFIDGLKILENPCNNSYCLINISKSYIKRNLESNKHNVHNIPNLKININISENNYRKINSKISKFKRNKNILQRRKLESYDSSNPGLSKEDIIEYIKNINATINEFYKIYLGKDYKYIKTAVNKYLIKVNGSCLNNLKRSFSVKLEKFSSLITEKKMKLIKDKILVQYFLIESFIHSKSNFIQELVTNFTEILNYTKEINKQIGEFIYQKSSLYYDILSETIHSKYKVIETEELYKLDDVNDVAFSNDIIDVEYKNNIGETVDMLDQYISKVDKYLYDKEKETKYDFNFGFKFNSSWSLDKNFVNYTRGYVIPIPVCSYLYLTLNTRIILGIRLDKYLNLFDKDNIYLGIGLYVRGEIGAGAEVGFYIPDQKSTFQISITAGLNGILASGRVGFRLFLFITKQQFEIDFYYIFNAFSFDFYIKFLIRISLWKFDMTFEYYIIRYIFLLHSKEKHKKIVYQLFSSQKSVIFHDRLKSKLK